MYFLPVVSVSILQWFIAKITMAVKAELLCLANAEVTFPTIIRTFFGFIGTSPCTESPTCFLGWPGLLFASFGILFLGYPPLHFGQMLGEPEDTIWLLIGTFPWCLTASSSSHVASCSKGCWVLLRPDWQASGLAGWRAVVGQINWIFQCF